MHFCNYISFPWRRLIERLCTVLSRFIPHVNLLVSALKHTVSNESYLPLEKPNKIQELKRIERQINLCSRLKVNVFHELGRFQAALLNSGFLLRAPRFGSPWETFPSIVSCGMMNINLVKYLCCWVQQVLNFRYNQNFWYVTI